MMVRNGVPLSTINDGIYCPFRTYLPIYQLFRKRIHCQLLTFNFQLKNSPFVYPNQRNTVSPHTIIIIHEIIIIASPNLIVSM